MGHFHRRSVSVYFTSHVFLISALAAGAGAMAPHLLAAPTPAAPVAYRTLGRTGLKVTTVSFGCMVTSDPSVIERAVDAGINHFDTARVYSGGNNERMVGTVLKPHRKKLIISRSRRRRRWRAP